MKRYTVRLADEALVQARQIHAWWRANRKAAPRLFRDELDAAMRRFATTPLVGRAYDPSEIRGMRRLRLPRTNYHVYYVVNDESRSVLIHAVWHGARGQEPPLR